MLDVLSAILLSAYIAFGVWYEIERRMPLPEMPKYYYLVAKEKNSSGQEYVFNGQPEIKNSGQQFKCDWKWCDSNRYNWFIEVVTDKDCSQSVRVETFNQARNIIKNPQSYKFPRKHWCKQS